jgi:transcriptional regulator with XRE-family HTH domain
MQKSIHTARQEHLRLLLKSARKAAGLTQDQLAAKISAYKSFVSKYERGERQLDVIEFIDVCAALKLDAHDILKRLG